MKDELGISRRNFIQRISFIGVASIGAGSLLSACGGGSEGGAETDTETTPETGTESTTASLDCTDTSALTEADLQTRQNSQYVDESPEAEKLCSNCQFYTAAPAEGQCGGCQIVKGPINPDGYCNLWVAIQQSAT